MSYSPTSRFTATAQDSEPQGGLAGTPGVNRTTLEALLDRAQWARDALLGQLVWSGQMWFAGSAAAPSVFVGSIAAVSLLDGTTRRVFSALGGTLLDVSNVTGGGPLAAGTWYYVYAYVTAGPPAALAFEITTDPPTEVADATVLRLWKRATTTHRYLGCFPTDGTGKPLPLRRTQHGYHYVVGGCPSGGAQQVLAAGNDTTWADVSCAGVVPPHAFVAQVYFRLTNGGAGAATLQIRTYLTSTNYEEFQTAPGAGVKASGRLPLVLGTLQRLQYQVDLAGTAALLAVHGFEEG